MENIKDKIKVLYTMDELQKRIKELGEEISKDYEGKEIVIVSVLKGAIFYTVDLVKNITTDVVIDFMKVSSYEGTESTGVITIKQDLGIDIEGKHVLIVEDIIDTGRTLRVLREELLKRKPASLKITTLMDKKERREVELDADYVGFTIPNKFVVGYGFDIDDRYRNIPYVGYIEN
jgi:hypoxanthine phosphoribosyltransferase